MENMQKINSIKTILVTNTRAYSESSSIAADLAVLVAQNSKKVALLDADLRHPFLHRQFNLPNRVGLADILQGLRSPEAVMHKIKSSSLKFLPAGMMPSSSGDLLASPRMAQLLEELDSHYDKVIIHGPPFFYTETTSLAAQVDGVVLLIHPDHTRTEASKAIIEKFQKTGATIIGIVMRDRPKPPSHQSAFIDRILSYDRQVRYS